MSADAGPQFSRMRDVAREVFLETLKAIDIRGVMREKLESSRGVLRIADDLYDLSAFSRIRVIAMGKAAHPMLAGFVEQAGPNLEGMVVCAQRPDSQISGFRYFEGGHPLPNEESLAAAKAVLKTVSGSNPQTLIVYLISGGASAMLEAPFDEEVSLDALIATYRVLVHSGASIAEINTIRKHLSAIKGGRLASAAYPARQVSIMVSDVPESSPDALASGPTMPDSTSEADCYRIAEQYGMLSAFPESVRTLFEYRALAETPKADDAAFTNARWWTILSSATAAEAAATLCTKHGYAIEIDNTPDDLPHDKAADYLLGRVRELRKGVSRVALVSAGEVTVKVPKDCGSGGRNQHFALYCATKIAGENITVLSAGTDGLDGNSPAAGAVVDGSTMQRATERGLDATQALQCFDSFPLFEKLGDSVVTGPSGNNVRDLRIFLAH